MSWPHAFLLVLSCRGSDAGGMANSVISLAGAVSPKTWDHYGRFVLKIEERQKFWNESFQFSGFDFSFFLYGFLLKLLPCAH